MRDFYTATSITHPILPQHTELDPMPDLSQFLHGKVAFTPPVISLVLANLVTIGLAILENWDVLTVLFIFWAQSLIIGFFTTVSLLFADTDLLAAGLGKAEEGTGRGTVAGKGRARLFKVLVAGFFAFHYGLFHLFYFVVFFWNDTFRAEDCTGTAILVPLAFFLFSHLFSLLWSWKATIRDSQFMADSILLPYNRIVPMHLTMIFGFGISSLLALLGFESLLPVLVVFIILKTYMDIRMHTVLHERQEHPENRQQLFVWL